MGAPIQTTGPRTRRGPSGPALARPDAISGPCRSFGSHKQTSAQILNPWDPKALASQAKTNAALALAAQANASPTEQARLENCGTGTWAFENGERLVGPDGSPARVVYSCEHRLCPRCARRRAAKLVGELEPVIAEKWKGRPAKLLTFTQNDQEGASLKSEAERILGAFKKLCRRVAWKRRVLGGVVSVEVTRNQKRGTWHVHLHVLADLDYWPQAELLALWRVCLNEGPKAGGVNIQQARKGLREVVKYVAKGVEASTWKRDDLQELMAWMRGRRLLRTIGNLYNVKLPKEEGEGAHEEEETLFQLRADGFAGINPTTGELIPEARATWRSGAKANAAGNQACAEWWRQKNE